MESGIRNNRATTSPEDKSSREDEKLEDINKFFDAAPAHLDWELVKEYDPDCVSFF